MTLFLLGAVGPYYIASTVGSYNGHEGRCVGSMNSAQSLCSSVVYYYKDSIFQETGFITKLLESADTAPGTRRDLVRVPRVEFGEILF